MTQTVSPSCTHFGRVGLLKDRGERKTRWKTGPGREKIFGKK